MNVFPFIITGLILQSLVWYDRDYIKLKIAPRFVAIQLKLCESLSISYIKNLTIVYSIKQNIKSMAKILLNRQSTELASIDL